MAAGTSGVVAGGTRSATFAARGQGRRGTPLSSRSDITPKSWEKPTHVKLSESEKGASRMVEGLAKGTVRQPFTPGGPTVPAAPDAPRPSFTEVPKQPFGRPSYTVRSGDDLTTIASALLGDGARWRELVGGATPAIADPDHIHPGQIIALPR